MAARLNIEEQINFARKAMNGDNDAWSILFNYYHDSIRNEVLKRIYSGTRDAEETANDITIEIFEEIHSKLLKGEYNFKNSFSTFIWHFSAKYRIIKYWKEKERFTDQLSDQNMEKTGSIDHLSHQSDNASEDLWQLFTIITASSAKPHQIIVFILSTVLENGYKEIEADLSGMSLLSLSKKIRDDYFSYFPEDEDMSQFEKYFEPLFGIMNSETKKVYKEREYAGLRNKYPVTGDIPLSDFFGNKSGNELSDKFSDWCYDTRLLVWEKTLGFFDICFLLKSHGGNYEPHKVIACCYLKLLKEKRKSIAENSDGKNLSILTDSFYETYFSHIRNGSNDSNGKEYLKPLYDQLEKSFEEVYHNPEYSVDSEYATCKNKKTGTLLFENFYNDCFKPGRNDYKSECLKKWSESVRNGVYKSERKSYKKK